MRIEVDQHLTDLVLNGENQINSLHAVMKAVQDANRHLNKKNDELRNVPGSLIEPISCYLFGDRIAIDNYGQINVLSEVADPDYNKLEFLKKPFQVLKSEGGRVFDLFAHYYERKVNTTVQMGADLPDGECACVYCGKKWTIDNVLDHITTDAHANVPKHYHRECFSEQQTETMLNIVDCMFIELDITKKPGEINHIKIPNEYGSESYRGKWLLVQSPRGYITIGWRKRVIIARLTAIESAYDGLKFHPTSDELHAYNYPELAKNIAKLYNIDFSQEEDQSHAS